MNNPLPQPPPAPPQDRIATKGNPYGATFYKFPRRGIYTDEINNIWAVDLIDVSKKTKGHYLMNAIDVFSRKSECVKIKKKTTASIKKGFELLFQKFGAKPKKIWSDLESGLMSLSKNWLADQNIEVYHTRNAYEGLTNHSPIVERLNRTLRDYMMELKAEHPNQTWNTLFSQKNLDQFAEIKNNTKHRTLKEKPQEVYDEVVNPNKIQRLHGNNFVKPRKNLIPLAVGQKVLLQKPKKIIRDKTESKYYPEVYTITEIVPTNPITYKIDPQWNGLDQSYYRQQFKLVGPQLNGPRNIAPQGAVANRVPIPAPLDRQLNNNNPIDSESTASSDEVISVSSDEEQRRRRIQIKNAEVAMNKILDYDEILNSQPRKPKKNKKKKVSPINLFAPPKKKKQPKKN